MSAKSDFKKCVRQAQNIVKTDTESKSAYLRQAFFGSKVDKKLTALMDHLGVK